MWRIIVLLTIWVLLVPGLAPAGQEYVIGIACINQQDCSLPELENIVQEAYDRIGRTADFRYLPFLRSLDEANTGILDGCAARTRIAAKGYSNLIQVPFPLLKHSHSAVTTKPGIKVKSLEDLEGYAVGIQRGNIAAIDLAEQAGHQVYLFNSLVGAFNMIEAGRLDMIVMDATVAEVMVQTVGLETYFISEPLAGVYTYHTLNKEHEELAPKLAFVFKEMLEDGTTKRLLGRFQALLPELPIESE